MHTSGKVPAGLPDNLEESELGAPEYWSSRYAREMTNFCESGDVGEIWFGETVERRIARWTAQYIREKAPGPVAVAELGCGNGHLLIDIASRLAEADACECRLTGYDYVAEAVALAKQITASEGLSDAISYVQMDLLDTLGVPSDAFDVLLDKGTLDAISLSGGDGKARQRYVDSVARMLKAGGILLITSCNWTRDELLQLFGARFSADAPISHAQFSFGGQSGATVCTLAFTLRPQFTQTAM